MKFKPVKIEWMITRKCNLKCEYCQIIDSKTLRGEEITKEDAEKILRYISKAFPNVQVVCYGGEPTVIEWLPDIIEYAKELSVPFAVISNGTAFSMDDSLEENTLFSRLIKSGVKNWSASVDWIEGLGEYPCEQAKMKSKQSLDSLICMRGAGVPDVVACITVSKYNIDYLPQMVDYLTSQGIWSITTPIQVGDWNKDGSNEKEYSGGTEDMLPSIEQVRACADTLYKMAASGEYLMHNDKEVYGYWEKYFIAQDWKCGKDNSVLTIDADGTLKRCVDTKDGLEEFSFSMLASASDSIHTDWFKEMEESFWDSYYEAFYGSTWCKP